MHPELININKIEQFKNKEDRLSKAIEKVDTKLKQFKGYADKIQGNWSDKDREYTKDWNNLHDLRDRLESRLFDNWSEFKTWHFDTFGFNTYSF